MAYRSSLNVSSINKSLSGLNKSLLAARESAKNVNTTIVQSTREKRKSFSANIKAFNQRREAVRRKEREDIVEASTVKGAISRSRTSVASSTRGFLGRIMDFLGTLLVGWAITNLPNIIKMAQSLMKRMQTYFGFLNQFKDGLQDFLISFGSMVGGVASSLGNFDFIAMKKLIDKGMGKMKDSFVQMSNSLNNVIVTLKQDINKLLGLDLFDIPGSDGDDSGDGNPPVSGSGPAGTAYGVDLNRLATATGAAEGAYNSVGVTVRGGGHGLGRYQFMTYRTDTTAVILKNAKAMGEEAAAQRLLDRANGNDRDAARQLLKYFPPKDQDALFKNHATNLLTQIKKKYPNASVEFLVKRFAAGHISGNFEDLTTPDVHGTTGKMHGDKIWREYQKAKPSPPPPAEAQKVSNFTMNDASKTGAYAGGDPEKSPRIGESIGDIISSNNSQKSTLLASNLQQTRQKPGTNTLLYNNEVIKTVYMPSNSYGGDVIVLAGGVNSGRRNRFLNSLA